MLYVEMFISKLLIKKRIIILFLLLQCLFLHAQDHGLKKIAILETVDKENSVPYGIKLMVRSKLTAAITATPGYEGYDRVDVGSILGEHEFQRTGLVSEKDIKRLGEMTGAEYILIPELAKLDQKHILIVAKILNVETAKVDKAANIQTATDVESMDEACRDLSSRLLGIHRGKTITL
ncbi:MAG: hypothetical protein K2K47_05935 [Duncaniella sp.]|nr:hypothetical protein [Duncaniella sp.]